MKIQLVNPYTGKLLEEHGNILKDVEENEFFMINGAWRFVQGGNYTDNFGFQWNSFSKTQIDKDAKTQQSKERFFKVTDWDAQNLQGENILEVGSGAGRFSQVVLDYTGANLYSVDYSNSVEANFKNNGHHERLKLFQASVYSLPFKSESFDKVFCFGVLQHTPDFKKSVKSLVEMVKPGGELVVDFYPLRGWFTKIHAKYIFRPITKRMKYDQLLRIIVNNAEWLIKTYNFFDKVKLGRIINRFLPICDIKNTFPEGLSSNQIKEWVILDTFDMFSPQHDHPQKITTVKKWFEEFGMKVTFADYITLSGSNKIAVVKGIKV